MLMLMPKASLRLGKDPGATGSTPFSTLLLGNGLSFETNETFLVGLDVEGFVFSNNERIESLGNTLRRHSFQIALVGLD